MPKADNLTEKQKMFVSEFVKDLNATRAAKAAGYKASSASVHGVRLLANDKVSQAIGAALKPTLYKNNFTKERILNELAYIAFFKPKYMEENEDDDRVQAAIKKVTETITESSDGKMMTKRRVYEFHDKVKALELGGKYHSLWTDKVEHVGSPKLTITKKDGSKVEMEMDDGAKT